MRDPSHLRTIELLAQRLWRWLRLFGVLVLAVATAPALAQCTDILIGDAPAICSGRTREYTLCGCSEYIKWTDVPSADYWEIWRQERREDGSSVGAPVLVAVVPRVYTVQTKKGKRTMRRRRVHMFARDAGPLLPAGTKFSVEMKSCNTAGCSPPSNRVYARIGPYTHCWYEQDGKALCQSN